MQKRASEFTGTDDEQPTNKFTVTSPSKCILYMTIQYTFFHLFILCSGDSPKRSDDAEQNYKALNSSAR